MFNEPNTVIQTIFVDDWVTCPPFSPGKNLKCVDNQTRQEYVIRYESDLDLGKSGLIKQETEKKT